MASTFANVYIVPDYINPPPHWLTAGGAWARADIVVTETGIVLKDRHGDATARLERLARDAVRMYNRSRATRRAFDVPGWDR